MNYKKKCRIFITASVLSRDPPKHRRYQPHRHYTRMSLAHAHALARYRAKLARQRMGSPLVHETRASAWRVFPLVENNLDPYCCPCRAEAPTMPIDADRIDTAFWHASGVTAPPPAHGSPPDETPW